MSASRCYEGDVAALGVTSAARCSIVQQRPSRGAARSQSGAQLSARRLSEEGSAPVPSFPGRSLRECDRDSMKPQRARRATSAKMRQRYVGVATSPT
ncbi:hypothetical protein JYU34_001264 [Plutella xylostella]|uniref:Uncharacterized protein n=1 Tax=Plutella xylostella TaxID=51655 RepID=A0ABQ7R6E9_PLUXY|nr:hypothetical protein JYU34_001264 [Plutella xylostella]